MASSTLPNSTDKSDNVFIEAILRLGGRHSKSSSSSSSNESSCLPSSQTIIVIGDITALHAVLNTLSPDSIVKPERQHNVIAYTQGYLSASLHEGSNVCVWHMYLPEDIQFLRILMTFDEISTALFVVGINIVHEISTIRTSLREVMKELRETSESFDTSRLDYLKLHLRARVQLYASNNDNETSHSFTDKEIHALELDENEPAQNLGLSLLFLCTNCEKLRSLLSLERRLDALTASLRRTALKYGGSLLFHTQSDSFGSSRLHSVLLHHVIPHRSLDFAASVADANQPLNIFIPCGFDSHDLINETSVIEHNYSSDENNIESEIIDFTHSNRCQSIFDHQQEDKKFWQQFANDLHSQRSKMQERVPTRAPSKRAVAKRLAATAANEKIDVKQSYPTSVSDALSGISSSSSTIPSTTTTSAVSPTTNNQTTVVNPLSLTLHRCVYKLCVCVCVCVNYSLSIFEVHQVQSFFESLLAEKPSGHTVSTGDIKNTILQRPKINDVINDVNSENRAQ